MIGVAIGQDCPVIDTPLNQLTGLFPDLQAIVVGLRRDNKVYVPDFNDTIQSGDEAFLVTASSDTERTLKIFGHEEREARRIVIVGGGNIGYQVAKELDTQAGRYSLSLIEAPPRPRPLNSRKIKPFDCASGQWPITRDIGRSGYSPSGFGAGAD